MKRKYMASNKAQYLQKKALSLLPKDKENVSTHKKILNISQFILDDIEVNIIQTDSVSSTMLLSQKWPFQLLNLQKRTIYAFMAGNDNVSKSKIQKQKHTPKNLLNLSIIFEVKQKQYPYITMMAAHSLLQAIKYQLKKSQCQLPLHIRWKNDVLIDCMKVGQISSNHVSVEGHFYTQLNIQVNLKNIPKNFGAYDFQPTYLQKFVKNQINLLQITKNIIIKIIENLSREKSLDTRKIQIKQLYENELIYINQKVIIYDKMYEHIHYTGNFLGVTVQGEAILQGYEKPFKDGVMKFDSKTNDYLHLFIADY